MYKIPSLLYIIFFLLFTLTLGGCSKYEEVNTTIEDVKAMKEQLRKAEQARQQAEEESTKFEKKISLILWMTGIGGLVFMLFSPLRNLFKRILFKRLSYKPRRFDKDSD